MHSIPGTTVTSIHFGQEPENHRKLLAAMQAGALTECCEMVPVRSHDSSQWHYAISVEGVPAILMIEVSSFRGPGLTIQVPQGQDPVGGALLERIRDRLINSGAIKDSPEEPADSLPF